MSSGFVSETELAEKRRQRQEEWEKVRLPDEPAEAPEEVFDHRSLFDRLEEQKQKKQQEYEEAHKLKNMIKGLDDDEVDFLDLVDRKKLEAEQKKELEEKKEILDFRKQVEKLQEDSLDQRIQATVRPTKNNHHSENCSFQQKLLKGAVIRKRTSESDKLTEKDNDSDRKRKRENEQEDEVEVNSSQIKHKGLTCIGILPSLCNYPDSSESETDSELDEKRPLYNLIGQQITILNKEEKK